MIFHDFFSEISDTLFPPLCLGCSQVLTCGQHEVFCPDCRLRITFLTGSRCPVCGIIFPDSPSDNHLCGVCLGKKPCFDSARAAVAYDGVIIEAIHKFKYGRNVTAGVALARLLADFDFSDIEPCSFDTVLPVPLHIRRLRERGFNQALIFARTLGKKYRIDVDFSLLKRHKFTLTQTGLNKKEREQNISGAFVVAQPKILSGRKLLLVDDVYTTGATINECARILKESGAGQVAVLTLARVL